MTRACDVYLGIFGPRYGYIVPQLGISATEMEYREAKKIDPSKVFVYVQDAEILDFDQKRFLEEVQSFSRGYFRHQKFTSCGELKEQVKRDMVTWTTRRVREALQKELELSALRDKVAHMSRVMERYGVPESLR